MIIDNNGAKRHLYGLDGIDESTKKKQPLAGKRGINGGVGKAHTPIYTVPFLAFGPFSVYS